MTQLSMSGVSVEFGATTLLRNVTFTVSAGERWGIVGRNGAGKTTLFRLITGDMAPTSGAIARQPGMRVSLLEQHRTFDGAQTVWEAAAGEFAELLSLEESLTNQAAALSAHSDAAMLDRYGGDLERFERLGGYTVAPRVDAVLHGLGFDPAAARNSSLRPLSGGERGRLALARQLVAPADILLLDEPTNHLDLETTRWFEQHLATLNATVLLISHDRALLSAVVDHVLHIDGGTTTAYVGGYESFVEQRAQRRLTQQRQYEEQRKRIADEHEYIARNIAGQNSRQAKGRRTRLERIPRLSPPVSEDGAMAVRFDFADRGGDRVATADRAMVMVGERVLIRDFSATLMRRDVVALIGPNGSGKSTFIKTLIGEHPLASGDLRVGSGVTLGHYRQDLAQVPLARTLYDVIADLRPAWERGMVQGHLGRFGFSGDEVRRRTNTLSGGERARVALAMLMLSRPNFLILDEPTNHLDVESIEALEDAIDVYQGTVLLVTHDRELLRALSTRLWVLHDSRVTDFHGTFAEWEQVSIERDHAARVRADEEEAVRRVQERRRTARHGETLRTTRQDARSAERQIAALERDIQRLEEQVQRITTALEDPELYVNSDGLARARAMGRDLEAARAELDQALEKWATASEAAALPQP